MPQWIPLDEVAQKLGVDRRTLYRWIKAGRLQSRKGDPRVYVDLEAGGAGAEAAGTMILTRADIRA